MNTKGVFSSASNEWETPEWLFLELNKEFDFEIDAAATKDNAKCERYFSVENDGLNNNLGGGTECFAIHHTEENCVSGLKKRIGTALSQGAYLLC